MKRAVLFFVFCIVVSFFSIHTYAETTVELRGRILVGQTRSIVTISPIEASYDEDGLYTVFNRNLGDVLIEIISYDTGEAVISTTVDSGEGNAYISFDGLDVTSGDYYVQYTTDYGVMWGDF